MGNIRLENLRKEFGGGVVAVANTNLTIEDGEFVVAFPEDLIFMIYFLIFIAAQPIWISGGEARSA